MPVFKKEKAFVAVESPINDEGDEIVSADSFKDSDMKGYMNVQLESGSLMNNALIL